ncbi:hypothetical protein MVEN_00043600 [Mycena venus]|uniref:Uncharacterized protein n=1 Tax=Mycena venus TaxID=2733690 RepID=A0A8H6Z7Q0_9AGAR|nr:hypothetical protein MVEN_00043600 [Mycena venus]
MPVIKAATEYLNDRIIVGGLKKPAGVKTKIHDCVVIYQAVSYLKTRSGSTRSDDFGCNVITQTESDVFEAICLAQPHCTPFCNVGWMSYSAFERLDPAKPKGDNVFRPCIGQQGNGVIAAAENSGSAGPDGELQSGSGEDSQLLPSPNSSDQFSQDWDYKQFDRDFAQRSTRTSPTLDSEQNSSSSNSMQPSTPTPAPNKCRADSNPISHWVASGGCRNGSNVSYSASISYSFIASTSI